MQSMTVKLFKNGQSQAVRIPKLYQFEGIDEVTVRKEGNAVIITPARKNWISFTELPETDADFMSSRPDLMDEGRVRL